MVSTTYIKELLRLAEQERLILFKRTRDGVAASDKKPGRAIDHLNKVNDELKENIKKYLLHNVGKKTISIADFLKNIIFQEMHLVSMQRPLLVRIDRIK